MRRSEPTAWHPATSCTPGRGSEAEASRRRRRPITASRIVTVDGLLPVATISRVFGPFLVALTIAPGPLRAETFRSGPEAPDRHELSVRGETYTALFRRALLPGPGGSLVTTDTVLPVRQAVHLRGRNLDTPWLEDAVDVELSAWGSATYWAGPSPGPVDGDVQALNLGYRQGPLSFRAGRQHVAGGAARYARFDGARAEVELAPGLRVLAYGGLTVLPRWNERPGYHFLGATSGSVLRDPSLVRSLDRGSHGLLGGRVAYDSGPVALAFSLHDQWEQTGLTRFHVGTDLRARVSERTDLGGAALLDGHAGRLADVRLFADTSMGRVLSLGLEYLHTEPALFLSRQSVLAVFSTDSYDELGGTARARVTSRLSVEESSFFQIYDTGRPGARTETALRFVADAARSTTFRIGYTRVQAPSSGYHAVRTTLTKRITERVLGTAESYAYLYDEAISGFRGSLVQAGTLSLLAAEGVRALVGASLSRSPYAAVDAQAMASLSLDLDALASRRRP